MARPRAVGGPSDGAVFRLNADPLPAREDAVKPPPFHYAAPRSVAEAIGLLTELPMTPDRTLAALRAAR